MPVPDTKQAQNISDEQYKQLLALNKQIKKELQDLREKSKSVRVRSQKIIDHMQTKNVLKNIIDTL
jgi:flagellar motility protein MotE (MotC chaperone)